MLIGFIFVSQLFEAWLYFPSTFHSLRGDFFSCTNLFKPLHHPHIQLLSLISMLRKKKIETNRRLHSCTLTIFSHLCPPTLPSLLSLWVNSSCSSLRSALHLYMIILHPLQCTPWCCSSIFVFSILQHFFPLSIGCLPSLHKGCFCPAVYSNNIKVEYRSLLTVLFPFFFSFNSFQESPRNLL